jgi:hypothetical protein
VSVLTDPVVDGFRAEILRRLKSRHDEEPWDFLTTLYALHKNTKNLSPPAFKENIKMIVAEYIAQNAPKKVNILSKDVTFLVDKGDDVTISHFASAVKEVASLLNKKSNLNVSDETLLEVEKKLGDVLKVDRLKAQQKQDVLEAGKSILHVLQNIAIHLYPLPPISYKLIVSFKDLFSKSHHADEYVKTAITRLEGILTAGNKQSLDSLRNELSVVIHDNKQHLSQIAKNIRDPYIKDLVQSAGGLTLDNASTAAQVIQAEIMSPKEFAEAEKNYSATSDRVASPTASPVPSPQSTPRNSSNAADISENELEEEVNKYRQEQGTRGRR